jgi:hypothetical protein
MVPANRLEIVPFLRAMICGRTKRHARLERLARLSAALLSLTSCWRADDASSGDDSDALDSGTPACPPSPDDFVAAAAPILCAHLELCPSDKSAFGIDSGPDETCLDRARTYYDQWIEARRECETSSPCDAGRCLSSMRDSAAECSSFDCLGWVYVQNCSGDTG